MNHEQRLGYCRKCINRGFDHEKGIVCRLTNDIARFNDYCEGYVVKIRQSDALEKDAIKISKDATLAQLKDRLSNGGIDMSIVLLLSSGFIALIALQQGEKTIPFVKEWLWLSALIIYVLYYWLFELISGKTVGKMVSGTVVKHRDGSVPNAALLFLRSLIRLIPIYPVSLFFNKQGLHDVLTSTRVVYIDPLSTSNEDILDNL